jgi:uncharacterized protein (DUF362 family)
MNTIFINYGTDIVSMTLEIMKEADIADLIHPGTKVYIKPNLVDTKPASFGSTTHPEIVEGIIKYLLSEGKNNISIFESSSIGYKTKDAIKTCGYGTLCKKYDVPFIDLDREPAIKVDSEGMDLNIFQKAANADFIINVPVMKGHCQTDITCCLKNLKGLIPNSEKSRFHSMGLHKPIAALASRIRPAVHIVDAICGDPTFELGGNPVESNRIMLGYDPVLIDSYCAELLGYRPDEIGYLKYAKEYGVGSYKNEKTSILELNAGNKPKAKNAAGSLGRRYRKFIEEESACSPCYAALITALNKLGEFNTHTYPIRIGQGFRGIVSDGIGVGNCTAGCKYYVKGCPPSAADIIELIHSLN